MANESKSLKDFRLLAFDIYGTLIDWDGGLYTAAQHLRSRLPRDHPIKDDRDKFIQKVSAYENNLRRDHPGMRYNQLLKECYDRLAAELGIDVSEEEAAKFSTSAGDWPAFPDTVDAMQRLGKHYKLVVLSNVDHQNFQATLDGPLKGVNFDAIYTAQDIGNYKPSLMNFEYLIEHVKKNLGVSKEDILMTAHGITSDQVPAKVIGLESAWIMRREALDPEAALKDVQGKVAFRWKFESLGKMAEEVEKELQG
ncbi:MAG: hypothetical protein M1827_006508 [Pycnora praestabilis]|nr:MAG: hypothetical protein M1827_006508 [Pycnora praestabilis]